MTAISLVAFGYDAVLDKMRGPLYGEIRFMPDDDYFWRLGQAARAHELAVDVLGKLWTPMEQTHLAFEEPWYYGAVKQGASGYLKQQAEIAGAVKGSLVRYGYTNLNEINNQQWYKVLREEGVPFVTPPRGSSQAEKNAAKLKNKFLVKEWAMGAWGLPDLPDLVKAKSGAKIPRPKEGFGSKAKAIQPNDIYDAAAVCAWMCDNVPSN